MAYYKCKPHGVYETEGTDYNKAENYNCSGYLT